MRYITLFGYKYSIVYCCCPKNGGKARLLCIIAFFFFNSPCSVMSDFGQGQMTHENSNMLVHFVGLHARHDCHLRWVLIEKYANSFCVVPFCAICPRESLALCGWVGSLLWDLSGISVWTSCLKFSVCILTLTG